MREEAMKETITRERVKEALGVLLAEIDRLREWQRVVCDHLGYDSAVDDVEEAVSTLGFIRGEAAATRDVVEALEAERAKVADSDTSDGYHTFGELYEYRMLYNAHAAHSWLAAGIPVVKSWHHSDGEPCFGGGWFIVTATLPTGQVSNHYKAEHWDLFDVPEVSLPPEYDGHTPQDAAVRLREALDNA